MHRVSTKNLGPLFYVWKPHGPSRIKTTRHATLHLRWEGTGNSCYYDIRIPPRRTEGPKLTSPASGVPADRLWPKEQSFSQNILISLESKHWRKVNVLYISAYPFEETGMTLCMYVLTSQKAYG